MQNNQEKEILLLEDLGYLYPTINSKQKKKFGVYKCFCGNEFKAQIYDVKIEKTKSCGCYQKQRASETHGKHGLSKHRIYATWNNMMDRCYDATNPNYKYYGAREIIVCDRWHDVKNFIEDMYPSYIEGLTIDRENNNLGYSKDNCRWTTQTIQSRNTRILYSHNTTGYRGVHLHKKMSKYVSVVSINNKNIVLGYFNTAVEAAGRRDEYVIENNLEHTLNKDLLI